MDVMTNYPVRMARWSAGHPWRAVVGWFLFVVLCLGAGIAVGGNAATSADFGVGEAGRGEAIAREGGLAQRPVERVLIEERGAGRLERATGGAVAGDVVDRMRGLPEVRSVAEPVWSRDGRAVRVDVTMKGAELDGKKHVDPLRAQTEEVQKAHPGLRVEETGGPSISQGVDKLRGSDLSRTEMIALPITLLTLLLVFRSVAMATVPLLLALSAIVASIGLSMLASHVFPDAGVGTNIILLIGLAVGVDYTLFYLKREREERARSEGQLDSRALVEIAAATSGRAVVLSGLAVAVSSATLYLADDVIFSSIATAAILVTLVAVVSSLTVLPALLVKIGARAERRAARKPRKPRKAGVQKPIKRNALLRLTARRPGAVLTVAVLAMLALAAPLLGLKLTDMGRETHSRQTQSMPTFDRLNAAFPEVKASHQVLVRADAERADEVAGALRSLAVDAKDDPGLNGTYTLRSSADHRVTSFELPVPHYVSTEPAAGVVAAAAGGVSSRGRKRVGWGC